MNIQSRESSHHNISWERDASQLVAIAFTVRADDPDDPQSERLGTGARCRSLATSIERQFFASGASFQAFSYYPPAEPLRGGTPRANTLARLILATAQRASPRRTTRYSALQRFSMGGTGLEPVTPSLSIRGSRSRQFARVRSGSMVQRNPPGDRTLGRNANER